MPRGSGGVYAKLGEFAQGIDEYGNRVGPKALIRSTEDLEGSYGDDVLIGDNKANHVLGRHGSDILKGGGGNDQINAKKYGSRDRDRDRRVDGGGGHDRAILDPEDRGVVDGSVEDPHYVAAGKPKPKGRRR
jgi:Ca2+-binding RTX toxin-like protein